jgi:hypothetical protein
VSKLCATDKKKKVEFCLREITQGSKKKTYGPYLGHIEKLKKKIELQGRVIEHLPVALLKPKISSKKGGVFSTGNFGAPIMSMNNFELTYDKFKTIVQKLITDIAYQEQSGYNSTETELKLREFYKYYPYYLKRMSNENTQTTILAKQQQLQQLQQLQLQQQQQQQQQQINFSRGFGKSWRTNSEYTSPIQGQQIDPRLQFATRNRRGRLIDPNTGQPFPN